MSAMSAERLRDPEKLYSPPDRYKEGLERILRELPPESAREFIRQVLDAVNRSKMEGDLRPLDVVVQSWVRTLMFMTRSKFDELWEEAEHTDGPRLTLEDIRKRRAERAR